MAIKSGKCIRTSALVKVLDYGMCQMANIFLIGEDTVLIKLQAGLYEGKYIAEPTGYEVLIDMAGFYDDTTNVICVPRHQFSGEVYISGLEPQNWVMSDQPVPTRVLVNLHGGAIHDVQADRPAEVLFISNHTDDVAEFIEDPKPALVPVSEDMADPHAWWHHTADVAVQGVDHFFDQLKDI